MPDEDKTFSGSFVLDVRIWWRQAHTLYYVDFFVFFVYVTGEFHRFLHRGRAHQYDYNFGFLWIAGSAILVLRKLKISLAEKYSHLRVSIYMSKLSGFKSVDSKFPL